MTVGDVVEAGAVTTPVARPNYIGVREAMGRALKAFLENADFLVYGADDPQDTEFKLKNVMPRWPLPDEELSYPSASIVEIKGTAQDSHSMTPTMLEETWGEFDHLIGSTMDENKTVLWKEAEAATSFQVDFWTELDPDREAIEGALPAIFSPGDGRYGVMIEGPELYYSRTVRATLEDTHFDDDSVTSYRHERRLRCVVRCECDIVSLRMAQSIVTPRTPLTVIDPNDPPEEV